MSKNREKNRRRYQVALAGEVVQMQINQKKLAALEASLIDRKQLDDDLRSLQSQAREHWHAWPAEVAPWLATKLQVDPVQLQEVLQGCVDNYLSELGDDIPTF